MSISELIKTLEEMKALHGDLEVCVKDHLTYSKPWLTINKLTNEKMIIAIN